MGRPRGRESDRCCRPYLDRRSRFRCIHPVRRHGRQRWPPCSRGSPRREIAAFFGQPIRSSSPPRSECVRRPCRLGPGTARTLREMLRCDLPQNAARTSYALSRATIDSSSFPSHHAALASTLRSSADASASSALRLSSSNALGQSYAVRLTSFAQRFHAAKTTRFVRAGQRLRARACDLGHWVQQSHDRDRETDPAGRGSAGGFWLEGRLLGRRRGPRGRVAHRRHIRRFCERS